MEVTIELKHRCRSNGVNTQTIARLMNISRIIVFITIAIGGCTVDIPESAPRFLLIVQERLRAGSEEAYNKNELQLVNVCAALKCPHPYLALATVTGHEEVWWLNAFTSEQERDGLDASYASNEPLMAAMGPLGKRKENFRESFTSIMTEFRRDLGGKTVLRIAGARFLVVTTVHKERVATGAVFQAVDGKRFEIASANNRSAAEDLAEQFGSGSIILAVRPEWSFPAESWIDADPEFWQFNPVARGRETSRHARETDWK